MEFSPKTWANWRSFLFLLFSVWGMDALAQDAPPAQPLDGIVIQNVPDLEIECLDCPLVLPAPTVENFQASNLQSSTSLGFEGRATGGEATQRPRVNLGNRLESEPVHQPIWQGPAATRPAYPPSATNIWPQPLGSTNLSPRAIGHVPAEPVGRHAIIPPFVRPATTINQTEVPSEDSLAYPGSPNVPPVVPDSPEPQVHRAPEVLSTALPQQYNIPYQIATGPPTGHRVASREVSTPELPNLTPPRSIANVAYPVGGIDPEETFSINNHSYPGLGFQYYDRFLNGGYGQTDYDGNLQINILSAQAAGLLPTPLPPAP